MKKICLVLYYYTPYVSGLSDYCKNIAEELVRAGNEVTIYTTNYDKKLKKEEIINGVKVVRENIWFSFGKGVFSPKLILNTIKDSKNYDIVAFFLPFAESGIFPFFIDKKKIYSFYVCDIRVGDSFIAKSIEFVLYKSMKLLLNRSAKIIPLSLDYFTHSRIYNEKKYGFKSEGLVPFVSLENTQTQIKDFRKEYKISKDTFVIGFLGRIVYEKGIEYLIKSITYLKSSGVKNFKIIIGGDYKNIRGGSVIDSLKDLIEIYKDNVIVTGFIEEKDKPDFFRALDVFVLPSIDPLEAFGIVQIESMKYNVPVIASSLPGVREVIQNTKFGYLAKPKSPEDIAEKILKIYKDKSQVSKYNKNYINFYSEDLWKKNLLHVMSIKNMQNTENKKFDEDYYNGNGQSGDRVALKMYFDIYKKLLPTNSKVLEFGSGVGHLNKRLATKFDTYAYDISEFALDQVKKISPNSHIVKKETDFKHNSMDGIITLHTLEHVPDPKKTLQLLANTLKKDGILFYVVPNIDGLGHKIKKDKWFGFTDPTHISMLPTKQWKEYTEKAGFKILKTSSDGFWDVPYLPLLPNIIQKLIFFPSAAFLVIFKKLWYPESFGECLIVIAKKVK